LLTVRHTEDHLCVWRHWSRRRWYNWR